MTESGYLYLVWPREFASSNKNIIKFGFSCEENVFERINKYGNGSELIYYFYVNNPKELENKLIKIFTVIDEDINTQKYYGKEYFKIKPIKMLKIVNEVVSDYLIKDMDIKKDILNKQHKKLSLYFDQDINSEIYDYVIKNNKNYTNNYTNRQYYFYNYYIKNLYNNIYKNILLYELSNIQENILYDNVQDTNDNKLEDIIDNTVEDINNNTVEDTNDKKLEDIIDNTVKDINVNTVEDTTNIVEDTTNIVEDTTNIVEDTTNIVEDTTDNNLECIMDNKVEDKNNKLKKITNKSEKNNNYKAVYICHYCLDSISIFKSDVIKHMNKIYKCKPYSNLFDLEQSSIHSVCKRYTFYFDKNKLNKNDLLFIISNYNNEKNYIYEDFRNPILIAKNNDSLFTIEELKNNELKQTKQQKKKEEEEEKEEENKEEFICFTCETKFKNKYNLLKHSKNERSCKSKKEYNTLMKKNKEELKKRQQN